MLYRSLTFSPLEGCEAKRAVVGRQLNGAKVLTIADAGEGVVIVLEGTEVVFVTAGRVVVAEPFTEEGKEDG
jgi:hypothetical protein